MIPQIKNKLELLKSFRFIANIKKDKKYKTGCYMDGGVIPFTIVNFDTDEIVNEYTRCIYFLKNYKVSDDFEQKILIMMASIIYRELLSEINQYDREFIFYVMFSLSPPGIGELKEFLDEVLKCPEEDLVDFLLMLKLKM